MVRTGIDLVELPQMKRRLERSPADVLAAFLTDAERDHVQGRIDRAGTRWAAKEAVMKALGWGLDKIDPRDIEVVPTSAGPIIALHGRAEERANDLGLEHWSVSLSHTDNYAVACVVAIGENHA